MTKLLPPCHNLATRLTCGVSNNLVTTSQPCNLLIWGLCHAQPWKIDKVVRTGTLYQKLQGCRINFAIDPRDIPRAYYDPSRIPQQYIISKLIGEQTAIARPFKVNIFTYPKNRMVLCSINSIIALPSGAKTGNLNNAHQMQGFQEAS